MANRESYKTRQSQQILDCLKEFTGKHVTVNEISEYFHEHGMEVGTTTIYRRLSRLMDEGLVARYHVEGKSGSCYELTGSGTQKPYFYCKCEKCGALIPVYCDEVEHLKEHMFEHHGFQMNSQRTIVYGLCSECRSQHWIR